MIHSRIPLKDLLTLKYALSCLLRRLEILGQKLYIFGSLLLAAKQQNIASLDPASGTKDPGTQDHHEH